MSHYTEPAADAWARRESRAGSVDFTMMYIAHDAFNRDLDRLIRAVDAGEGFSPAAAATWQSFSKQLHTHHTAEDTALWPRLHAAVTDPDEVRILTEMEAEHAALDPMLEQIDAMMRGHDAARLGSELKMFAEGLSAHMIHEETDALPLLERRTGQQGWDAFGKEIRGQQGGLKGAAEYLPWVLDGATARSTAKVLAQRCSEGRRRTRRRRNVRQDHPARRRIAPPGGVSLVQRVPGSYAAMSPSA